MEAAAPDAMACVQQTVETNAKVMLCGRRLHVTGTVKERAIQHAKTFAIALQSTNRFKPLTDTDWDVSAYILTCV